jgi:hypothetical protein
MLVLQGFSTRGGLERDGQLLAIKDARRSQQGSRELAKNSRDAQVKRFTTAVGRVNNRGEKKIRKQQP